MPITHALRMAIIDCLKTFPNIEDLQGRRALVAQARLDASLAKQISYSGPLHEFCALFVAELEEYGRLKDGRHALQAVVEAMRAHADPARKRECNLLLKDLRREIMLANVAESARRRWYVLAAAMVLLMGLMVSARYVVAWYLVGNGHVAPADQVAVAQPTLEAATPVAPSATATVAPSPTVTFSPAPTRTPMPTETRPASPTSAATRTPLPTHTAAPSPTWTDTPISSPTPTRTLAPTATPTPQPVGLRRTIRLEAPEIAITDTKGTLTFQGLAVECLDAKAAPLVDSRGRRFRIPLSGVEGNYILPQGTVQVVLWVDPAVYGDWWSRFNAQPVDVTAQETITLRIVPLSQPGQGEKPWPPIK